MKQIKLTRGQYALVDDEDYDSLSQYKWYCSSNGYACRRPASGIVYMHRVLAMPINGLETDHINRNRLDNQKHNLRPLTRTLNNMNSPSEKNSSSKYRGVYFCKARHKWIAQISINRKPKNLGGFNSEEDAARVYNEAAEKYYGSVAYKNEVSD